MTPVVLFDGDCSLCHRSVRFILRRDPAGVFRFQSLDHPDARAWLESRLGAPLPDSLVLMDEEGLHLRSRAALRIARRLSAPWAWWARLAGVVPRRLADAVYDAVARRRRRLLGRPAADCPINAVLPPERLWVPPAP